MKYQSMAVITQYDAPYHQLIEEQRAYYSTGITAKLEHRRKQLLKLKRLLTEETDVLTKAVYNDLRRSPKLTHSLELSAVLVEIDYMLDNLEQWSSPEPVKKTLVSLLDTVAIVKEPLGVVLIIAPWNYPLSLVLLPLVAAVAAGNTVVVKPSEYASFTSAALHDLFSHFFDPQFLAVVNGGIVQTTDLLKEKFDHILYTGNSLIAKVIMTAAAQHLTPVTLELGGKSRLCGLLSRSKGQILYKGGELNRNDLFIPPIIISVSADDALMKDEIFGPILPIITTNSFDEAISFIRSKEKPLAIYLFTRSERKVRQLYAETSSGSVTVNDVMFQFLTCDIRHLPTENSGI